MGTIIHYRGKISKRRDVINRGMDILERGLKEISSNRMKGKSPGKIGDMIEQIFKLFSNNHD